LPLTYRKRNRWRSVLLLSAEIITFSGAITALKVPGWSVIPLRSSINIAPDYSPSGMDKAQV
jgi:hypothetical protein